MEDGMTSHHGMPSPAFNASGRMHTCRKMMMHMTFFWGKNTEVLFSGWPVTSSGMYALSLIFVFVLAIFVEYLSHSHLIKRNMSDVVTGLVQTCMHAVRVALAYMVMLAVMSFNGGVFLAAVAGHAVGFLFFGSWDSDDKSSDLPPMKC
ncbi:hypothetical protein L1049_008416 [Liquidambar formosana]|uniref:Copper transport protein n=1 Tax=Liquidambar formosana TaxID=63359 RepID=A0AAP0S680_LIQFO